MADEVGSARDALGRQLAASRRAAGLSQHQLAALSGYSRSTVANVETGGQHVPRDFWQCCDTALGTGTALARGYDDVEATARRRDVRTASQARQVRASLSASATGLGAGSLPGVVLAADGPGAGDMEVLRLRLDGILSGAGVSGANLDAWEQAALHHGRMTRYRPPQEMLVELTADLTDLS